MMVHTNPLVTVGILLCAFSTLSPPALSISIPSLLKMENTKIVLASTQELRNPSGRLLGRIIRVSDTRVEARDTSGKLLGYYNSKTNQTFDPSGRMIGRGDFLASLITNSR